jgi:glycosyltransferase involved in cell wall biosynthesis
MDREIGCVTIYSTRGLENSQESALVWYTKSLLSGMSRVERQKLVVFSNIKNKKQIFTDGKIEVNECWKRGGYRFPQQIIAEIEKYPGLKVIHIQHEFNLFGGPISILLYLFLLHKIKKLEKKIVVTYHGVIAPSAIRGNFNEINQIKLPNCLIRIFFGITYRWSRRYIDRVIVHEKCFKNILTEEYNFESNRVEVIPIGVDEINFTLTQKEARGKLNIPLDKKVLLFFGFLAGYKGIDLLLEAFQKLKPEEYFLILAGGKPKRVENNREYNKWHNPLIKRFDELPNVLRAGFVSDRDVEVYFQASDVLVMPYLQILSSSGPMSLAIAHKKPFLVSDVFREAVPDQEMIFQRNPRALADKIEEFFQNKYKFDTYIRSLREERLWSKIGQQTFQLYENIILA